MVCAPSKPESSPHRRGGFPSIPCFIRLEIHHERHYPNRSPHHPRRHAGSRRPEQEPDSGSAVAAGAAPHGPQRAQDPAHVHPRTGRVHPARGPAAKPHRDCSRRWRALRSRGRWPSPRSPQAAGEEAPHPEGMGGALPAGGRRHGPHRQPYRERAARSHAPGRPVRGVRRTGGRRSAHRRHSSGFFRHAAGGAAPLEAGECLAAPDGRLSG